MFNFFTAIVTASAAATVGAVPARRGQSASITTHDNYSSSIGVHGCNIDTNNIAYWPSSVDCDKICVKVTIGGRSRHLLKTDQSGGAYDISYDAWNYLPYGKSATEEPLMWGGVEMNTSFVDNDDQLLGSVYYDHVKTIQAPESERDALQRQRSVIRSEWATMHQLLRKTADVAASLPSALECSVTDLLAFGKPQTINDPLTLRQRSNVAGSSWPNPPHPQNNK